MVVAAATHFGKGDSLQGAAHAIELAVVFAGLMFVGPGKYSVDKNNNATEVDRWHYKLLIHYT
jgi:hypothetical protein